MGDQVWRFEADIPRLNFCGDTSRYGHEYIEQEIQRLRANLAGMFDAASAWRHGAEKLQALADRVWEVAHRLAEAWSSEESVQCQEALQRIERAARHLSTRSYQMHAFTNQSAEVIEQAVNNFSTDAPGTVEIVGRVTGGQLGGTIGSNVAGTVGSWVDTGLGAVGIDTGPSKDEVAQRHLSGLNQAYSEVNPLLPERVSVELPLLKQVSDENLVPPGGYAPGGFGGGTGGFGGPGIGGAGAHLPAPDGVPGVPPTGGFPAEGGVPEGYEWDGSTGGLAGATPLAPPAPGAGGIGGAGVPGVPPGAGAGGLPSGPGAAGAAVPPGGVVPAGAAGGRAGGGPGVPGSRGVPGAGRPGVGMIGAPVGAGGAAGGAGSGRGGAGRPGGVGGAGGAVGRGGMAGGVVPMGAGARGTGQDGAGRDTWLVEDENPWGTDDGTPPSVIG